MLKLNQQTARNWLDAGKLPHVRIGRRVRIKRSDFNRLIERGYRGGPSARPSSASPAYGRAKFSRLTQKPLPGELVRIEFVGERTAQSGKFEGKSYNLWRLSVARPPMVPDWSTLDTDQVKLDAFTPRALEAETVTISELAEDTDAAPEAGEDDDPSSTGFLFSQNWPRP